MDQHPRQSVMLLPTDQAKPISVPAITATGADCIVRIMLPGDPKGKGRPRSRIASSRGGRQFVAVYTDAKTRSYEGMLRLAGAQAMRGQRPLDRALRVHVTATFSIPQSWSRKRQRDALAGIIRPTGRPDCDNILKTIDALNGVVWRDDSLICECLVKKQYGDIPSLVIEVWEHTGLLL